MALTKGLYLGHFSNDSDILPYYLKGQDIAYPEQLLETEILVACHGLVPIRELVEMKFALAPDSSLRVDSERVVSLNLTPPES